MLQPRCARCWVAAPELIEVWRPGGRSEERRPRPDRNRHRHQDRAQPPQQGSAGRHAPVAAAGEAADGAKRERHGRGRRERNKDFRKPRTDAPVEAAPLRLPRRGAGREPRPDNRENREDKAAVRRASVSRARRKDNRDGRDKGKFGGGRDKGGRDKGDRDGRRGGPSHRQYATSAPPRERERPIDPNSPFAKLAALQ